MRVFQRGETVEVYAEVKNQAGTLVDPDTSINIVITDPEDTEKVASTAMSQLGAVTGKYVYYYTIPDAAASVGWWVVEVTVTDGTKITIIVGGFVAE